METNSLGFIHLQNTLQEIATDACEYYKYQLMLKSKRASGALLNSIKGEVNVNGNKYEVQLNLLDYWKDIEGGKKGMIRSPQGAVYPAGFPSMKAIQNWILVKPIIPKLQNGKLIPTIPQLTFLISRAIAHYGIEPHPALQTTIEQRIDEWTDKIKTAFFEDIKGLLSTGINIWSDKIEIK